MRRSVLKLAPSGAQLIVAAICLSAFTGCLAEPRARALDLGDVGTLQLAATDETLVAEAGSFIGAAYFAGGDLAGCEELLTMTTEELALYRRSLVVGDVALAATQAWPADPLPNDADPLNPEPSTHTFGALRAWGQYAFVVLASRLVKHYASGDYPFGDDEARNADDLAFAAGTVFAIGCSEVEIGPGDRLDVRVTLHPAGMR